MCDKRELEILVISCDKFDDCWIPFSECIHKFWPDCPYPISLCTETKDAPYDISLFTKTYKSDNKSWSARISDACNKINAEYVLFVLEDQWLAKQIENDAIIQNIEFMNKDNSIGVVYLEKRVLGERNCKVLSDRYIEIPQNISYRFSAGPAIWRKSYLSKILNSDENAWEFEKKGSFRKDIPDDKVLAIRKSIYYRVSGMGAITQGKWERSIPQWTYKNRIDVNLTKRPIRNIRDSMSKSFRDFLFNINPELIVKIQNLSTQKGKKDER